MYFDIYSEEARPTGVSEALDGLTHGVEYKVRVLAYNPIGDGTAVEVTVSEPNAAPSVPLAISGNLWVGQTLEADTSPIDNPDGRTGVSYRYQWLAGGSNIAAATGTSNLLTAGEEGQTVKVKVTSRKTPATRSRWPAWTPMPQKPNPSLSLPPSHPASSSPAINRETPTRPRSLWPSACPSRTLTRPPLQ